MLSDTGLTDPIPIPLIAATLDRLAAIPPGTRLRPEMLISIARSAGCLDSEMAALLVRIRAAAIIFADPHWLPWAVYFRSCQGEVYCNNDAALLTVIAELPLTSRLHFQADHFFDTLLRLAGSDGRS